MERRLVHQVIVLAIISVLGSCGSSSSVRPGGRDGTDPSDAATDAPQGGDETGGDAALLPPTCESYCPLVTSHCGSQFAQYIDLETCTKMCATMQVGNAEDTSGATLGCRLNHARAAVYDEKTECPYAGPFGRPGPTLYAPAWTCGNSLCDNFCDQVVAICSGVPGASFADKASCLAECRTWAFDDTSPVIDPSNRGSMNCAFYYAEAAAQDPATHCAHVSLAAGPCMRP